MLSSEYRGKGWWEQYANKALEVNKLQRHHCQANSSHWCSFSCNKEVTSSHQASCLHEPPHAWPAVSPSSRLWEVQRRWRVYIRRTAEEPCLQGALQQRSSSLPLLWGIKPQNVKSSARTEGRPDHRVQPRRGTANPGAGTVSPLPSPLRKAPPREPTKPEPRAAGCGRPDPAGALSGRSTARKGGRAAPRAAPRTAPGRSRPAPPPPSRGTRPDGAVGRTQCSAGPGSTEPRTQPRLTPRPPALPRPYTA